MTPLLQCHAVEKRFGGLQAINGCSFGVAQGSITGLIGPNGAGKTTLFNVVAGVYRSDAGTIHFDGNRIDKLRPHQIYRRRLARTFQIPRELKELTVLDNLLLFPLNQSGESILHTFFSGRRVKAEESAARNRAEAILDFVQLLPLRDDLARTLSGGQKKLLELARTLMGDPKMILLDEPGAGVNPTLMDKLSKNILELRDQGKTFLLVEHDMDVISRLCDHVVVMARGEVLTEGPFDTVRKDERVLEAYLAG